MVDERAVAEPGPAEDDAGLLGSAPAPWTFFASAVVMAGLLALSAALF